MSDPTNRSSYPFANNSPHPLVRANNTAHELRDALKLWAEANYSVISVTEHSIGAGFLPTLGNLSDDMADQLGWALDARTDRETHIDALLYDLADISIQTPSLKVMIQNTVREMLAAAGWSGGALTAARTRVYKMQTVRQPLVRPLPSVRATKGAKPLPPRHGMESCYGSPCIICEQCPDCTGHAAHCSLS